MSSTGKFRARIAASAIGVIATMAAAPSIQAQSPTPRLITQAIDSANLTTLAGNTRPEANAANDRGMVPDSMPLDHMLLQLRRSDVQERAFDTLIDQLHDPRSPNFHKWLSVGEIGTRFGPATADIQTVTGWLTQNGFAVNVVYPNGMVIDFSGNAGQIRTAFHTEIHSLSVNGVPHIANMSDPKIPTALAPAVAGVVSLHDFRAHANMTVNPPYTTATRYDVAPADLWTIYNFTPVFATGNIGQNQTIYLIESSNMYSQQDWYTFRSGFLLNYPLPSLTTTNPTPPGGGPTNCNPPTMSPNDDEATLDTEYASAAAPGAAIVLVVCAGSTTTDGLYIAIHNLISDGNYSPTIISMSYGESETDLLASGNKMFHDVYQTAVGMGISVFVSAGDEGAAASDKPSPATSVQIPIHGINVNGHASTPYNVAVGGTDFSDTYSGTTKTYWNSTNSPNNGSAKSYIPEIPWNNTCGSQLYAASQGYGATYGPTGYCNNVPATSLLQNARAGSGGPSACATGTPSPPGVVSTSTMPPCQGYSTPSWQTGVVGLPGNGVRVLPDVALFAANGPWQHGFVWCFSDTSNGGQNCDGSAAGWSYGGGGTSFAAPIMAGIQALVNQRAGGPQGNPNYRLYQLAAYEYGTTGNPNCNSNNGNAVGTSCIFHDITMGDNDVPCTYYTSTTAPTPTLYNCYGPPITPAGTNTNGVISNSNSSYVPTFTAATGWDYTTGIGSINVANLVMSWNVLTNTHDFNGDGKSDIAWRDSSGNTAIWLMNGTSVLSNAGIGNVPTSWSIVGQRDFNGDGMADLLWRDTSGNTAIWFMNGTQVASTAAIGNIPTSWSVVGTGIVPGEGSSAIFWRDTSGNYAMWLVSASTVQGTVVVTVPLSAALGHLPTATWSLAGVGDFNGDGQSDLLWVDTSGNYSIWLISFTNVPSSPLSIQALSVGNIPTTTTWLVARIGDFNGDGTSDIVWHDGNGNFAIWLMNGATVLASAGLVNLPPPWSIVQTGDYDGNGTSDLLWSDGAGDYSIWFMNGVTASSMAVVGNIATTWQVQSLNPE